MKSKQSEAWSKSVSSMSSEGLGEVSEVVAETAKRTRAVFDASVKALQSESAKFIDDFSSQSEVALEQIARCKSPLEVIAVQQGWVQARSLAYLQSSLRFAKTLASASTARATKAEPQRPTASPRSDGASHETRTVNA